jgi:hypothetical protein
MGRVIAQAAILRPPEEGVGQMWVRTLEAEATTFPDAGRGVSAVRVGVDGGAFAGSAVEAAVRAAGTPSSTMPCERRGRR